MANLLTSECLVLPSDIPGVDSIEVFRYRHGDVGRSFFIVQAFLLAGLGIVDKVEFRKREKKRCDLETLAATWGLTASDFFHGDSSGHQFKTTVLGSTIVLPWLFMKIRHFEIGRETGRRERCWQLVPWYMEIARNGARFFDGDALSMYVCNHTIDVRRDLHLDLSPIMSHLA